MNNKLNLSVIYLILLFFNSTLVSAADLPKAKDTKPDIKKVDYGTYMQDLQKRIQANWQPPKGKELSKVMVVFKVKKNGELIKDTLVVKESSSPEAEKAAREAVLITVPHFRPLPAGSSDDQEIELTFANNLELPLSNKGFVFHVCNDETLNQFSLYLNQASWIDKKIDCSIKNKIDNLLIQLLTELSNKSFENVISKKTLKVW